MLQINEPYLLLFQFEKMSMKDSHGRPSTYYYKRGIYLKFLCDGYYKVYNDDMQFLGTVNDLYRLQLLLIIKQYPMNLN